ncbi:hypothetical protein CHELA40_11486 [Chelatococcus asaccharovorans]|nr:hypothetical protein CHELA40_11486 [Chelatococcus asaccharovorans]CAH1684671.1 hypothetical protein CHELA17_64116 [Chelatococcus asaccharovorans]
MGCQRRSRTICPGCCAQNDDACQPDGGAILEYRSLFAAVLGYIVKTIRKYGSYQRFSEALSYCS